MTRRNWVLGFEEAGCRRYQTCVHAGADRSNEGICPDPAAVAALAVPALVARFWPASTLSLARIPQSVLTTGGLVRRGLQLGALMGAITTTRCGLRRPPANLDQNRTLNCISERLLVDYGERCSGSVRIVPPSAPQAPFCPDFEFKLRVGAAVSGPRVAMRVAMELAQLVVSYPRGWPQDRLVNVRTSSARP